MKNIFYNNLIVKQKFDFPGFVIYRCFVTNPTDSFMKINDIGLKVNIQ